MSTTTAPTPNPGYLKLELAAKGVRLDDAVRTRLDLAHAPRMRGATERGIEIVLPEDVWVSVPIDEGGTGDSPFLLSGNGGQFTLQRNGSRVEVRLVPPPSFYSQSTSTGRPMWQVGTIYGMFIAINPAAACGYSLRGTPCRFCRVGTAVAQDDGFPMSVTEVVEVVRAAFAEGAAEFVYFNTGYFNTEDGGIEFLEPYIHAVKRNFDTLVAVQLHPPKTNPWIDRTYAMGVDALSYGIEIHDPALLEKYCAGRVRYIGRGRYYEALRYAATIFPSGTVWSDLIVGLEPAESTRRGIDTLTEMAVLPVLAPFRPLATTTLRDTPAPSIEDVVPTYAHLFHAVRDAKINMGWLGDLSFAITPLEARFFAGDEARRAVVMQHFYRSKIGTLAARNLARLRRRLRVRHVSDSFDSSHL